MGTPTEFKGMLQIVNPKINPTDLKEGHDKLIEYPTVSTVPGREIKKIIEKIPESLWATELRDKFSDLKSLLELPSLLNSFKALHGKGEVSTSEAKRRIIFET